MAETFSKLLVKKILEQAHAYEWSLQGLGMLRLYLSDEVRLHVWTHEYRVPNASPLHDHPWSFESTIIAGKVVQYRYWKDAHGEPYWNSRIKCGAGTCQLSAPERVMLRQGPKETYHPHWIYMQGRDEIHESLPEDGTVTVVHRHFDGDKDTANVYWKEGDFVSAEPRRATLAEVLAITGNALKLWF